MNVETQIVEQIKRRRIKKNDGNVRCIPSFHLNWTKFNKCMQLQCILCICLIDAWNSITLISAHIQQTVANIRVNCVNGWSTQLMENQRNEIKKKWTNYEKIVVRIDVKYWHILHYISQIKLNETKKTVRIRK